MLTGEGLCYLVFMTQALSTRTAASSQRESVAARTLPPPVPPPLPRVRQMTWSPHVASPFPSLPDSVQSIGIASAGSACLPPACLPRENSSVKPLASKLHAFRLLSLDAFFQEWKSQSLPLF